MNFVGIGVEKGALQTKVKIVFEELWESFWIVGCDPGLLSIGDQLTVPAAPQVLVLMEGA